MPNQPPTHPIPYAREIHVKHISKQPLDFSSRTYSKSAPHLFYKACSKPGLQAFRQIGLVRRIIPWANQKNTSETFRLSALAAISRFFGGFTDVIWSCLSVSVSSEVSEYFRGSTYQKQRFELHTLFDHEAIHILYVFVYRFMTYGRCWQSAALIDQ